MLTNMFHKLAHWFYLNPDRLISWTREGGDIMIGFMCDECGSLTDVGCLRIIDYKNKMCFDGTEWIPIKEDGR